MPASRRLSRGFESWTTRLERTIERRGDRKRAGLTLVPDRSLTSTLFMSTRFTDFTRTRSSPSSAVW
eukprot:2366654-Prymnesium_polylepis.1